MTRNVSTTLHKLFSVQRSRTEVSAAPWQKYSKFERPVFVTGLPRSGKSLVCKVLSSCASEFVYFSEPKHIWRLSAKKQNDVWMREDVTPTDIKYIREKVRRALGDSVDARYIDDSALHSIRANAVKRVFPDSKFIHVIRNPIHIHPEVTSYWMGRNIGYAVKNKIKLNPSFTALPNLAVRFLANLVHKQFFKRFYYIGPVLPETRKIAVSFPKRDAPYMAAFQINEMLKISLSEMSRIDPAAVLSVSYEELVKFNPRVLSEIADFVDVDRDRIASCAADIIVSEYVSLHDVDVTDIDERTEALLNTAGALAGYGVDGPDGAQT